MVASTITSFEIPVPSLDPVSIAFNAAKILDVVGVDVPVVNDISSFVGGITGGAFGGKGHHRGSLPDFTVPSNLPSVIDTPNAFRSYRGLGGEGGILTGQTKSIHNSFYPARSELTTLGVQAKEVAQEFLRVYEQEIAMDRATSPADAIRRNQQAANLTSNLVSFINITRAKQIDFLSKHVGIQTDGKPDSYFFKQSVDKQEQLLRAWEDKTFTKSSVLASDKILNPLPTQPQQALNPINITVNVPPHIQSTLGQQSGIQTQKQPANPQTKYNWWQKFITAGRIASGVHTAVSLPFRIADIFSSSDNSLPLINTGTPVGEELIFLPNFPLLGDEQSDIMSFLPPELQDAQFTVSELQEAGQTLNFGSGLKKTFPYLFIGLLIAYLLAKRKRS
jgi:hypothetical protein